MTSVQFRDHYIKSYTLQDYHRTTLNFEVQVGFRTCHALTAFSRNPAHSHVINLWPTTNYKEESEHQILTWPLTLLVNMGQHVIDNEHQMLHMFLLHILKFHC